MRLLRSSLSDIAMVAAALTVVVAVAALMANHEVELRREQVRSQGLALSSTLSRIPFARLAPPDQRLGALSLVRSGRARSDFAYAVVVDLDLRVLNMEVADHVTPPPVEVGRAASAWSSERVIPATSHQTAFREFVAPILESERQVGFVRIGFVEPTHAIILQSLSFHASVALLVFLLAPFAYFWLRFQIRPLTRIASELSSDDDVVSSSTSQSSSPAETVERIADRLRAFREEADSQSERVSRERMALLASTKVASHDRNRIQLLIQAMPDAVLALDETGRVTIANQRAETLLKLSQDELVGQPAASWCPTVELMKLVARHSDNQGRSTRAETLEFSFDEQPDKHYLAQIQPLSSDQGSALTVRDVTEAWLARKTQAEFLAHMAHELKAPLNVMSLYCETLLGPDGEDETLRLEAANIISDEVDRLNGLINNIFSIGRIETGHISLDRQRILTRNLLADIFESTARGSSDPSLEFELDLPDEMDAIFADKALLSVAVKNLLTNAIKYNREGGRVKLAAELGAEGLTISISDTGVGIAEEDLSQVFEKFYRSEDESVRKIAGHGLGLALVKEIITLHGGDIRVESIPGEGSEFSFVFQRNSAIFREED